MIDSKVAFRIERTTHVGADHHLSTRGGQGSLGELHLKIRRRACAEIWRRQTACPVYQVEDSSQPCEVLLPRSGPRDIGAMACAFTRLTIALELSRSRPNRCCVDVFGCKAGVAPD